MAMAVDPQWLESWISERGPYLYHSARTFVQASLILDQGLLPWDENDSGAQWYGIWRPRPGHVYLGTMEKIKTVAGCDAKEKCLRVDLRLLDPERINPDEDLLCSWPSWKIAKRWPAVRERGSDESFGEWAENHDFGLDPEDTQLSLERLSSIAYRGRIPVEALSPSSEYLRYCREREDTGFAERVAKNM